MTDDSAYDDTPSEIPKPAQGSYDEIIEQHRPRDSILAPTIPAPPLLPGESLAEFDKLKDAINRTLKPCDYIEELHCDNVAQVVLEERRLRRWRHSVLIE